MFKITHEINFSNFSGKNSAIKKYHLFGKYLPTAKEIIIWDANVKLSIHIYLKSPSNPIVLVYTQK